MSLKKRVSKLEQVLTPDVANMSTPELHREAFQLWQECEALGFGADDSQIPPEFLSLAEESGWLDCRTWAEWQKCEAQHFFRERQELRTWDVDYKENKEVLDEICAKLVELGVQPPQLPPEAQRRG